MSEIELTAPNACPAEPCQAQAEARRKYRQSKHPHLLISAIALTVFTVLYSIVSVGLSAYVGIYPDARDDYSFNMILILLSQLACMLPPVLIMCGIRKMDFLSVMRLRKGVNFIQILMLLGISYGLIYVANGLNNIFMTLLETTTGYVSSGSSPAMTNVWQMLFTALLYGMLPAFCEEFFFRGLIMRSLERFSPVMAVVGSAVLFGIMHGNLAQLLFATVIGLVLAIVVRRTDSLLPAMIIHFANNFIAIIITFVQQQLISSGAMENALAATPIETIATSIGMIISGAPFVGIIIPYIIYTKNRNKKKYGNPDPEELRKGYTEVLQSQNVTFRNGEAVQVDRAGRVRVLAYVLMALFLASQLGSIILEFAVGTGLLG